jgi:apolipoprotein N-acyltransferase
VERQQADAVLWSETVYPTTFGHAKSEAGAELDREIQAIVDAAGVPFVFGTYDRDAAGEYNAAAFLVPRTGLLGFYRKTRLFPFTEALPAWLDTPAIRTALPWAGAWLAGSGARVMPLRLRDGREVPVLPLICRDDTDASLAIAGARLGAQALLTMSNDAWFGERGAALHQAVAAFRSIETGLPQFRVTTTGYSAVIDARGELIATTRWGERTLVMAGVPVHDVAPTLMVAWGDWVGHAAAVALAGLSAWALLRRFTRAAPAPAAAAQLPARLLVLPPAARVATALLRALSRGSLLGMVAVVLLGDGSLQSHTLALIRSFVALCLLPEALAWVLLRTYAAQAAVDNGTLVLTRGAQRLALSLSDIAAVEPWRLPLPAPGATLRLANGTRWPFSLAAADARLLAAALGAPLHTPPASAYALSHQRRRRSRFGKPVAKFLLLPFLLAVPAFQLHQRIAYGSPFGEFYSYGLAAYLSAFALWWAAWVVGVVLCAAALRALIEAGTLAGAVLRPAEAPALRRGLEQCGLAALYLGLPGWLLLRLLAD